MPGEKPNLTPLESRRQLLVLESELNRALLLNEVRDLKNEMHQLKAQVNAMGSLVSFAAELASTFAAVGNAFTSRSENGPGRSSWISTLVHVVKVGASVWNAFRSHYK
jgi:hypothetical protein